MATSIESPSGQLLGRPATQNHDAGNNHEGDTIEPQRLPQSSVSQRPGLARHTAGIILLLVTVLLWTASNFLASVRAYPLYLLLSVAVLEGNLTGASLIRPFSRTIHIPSLTS